MARTQAAAAKTKLAPTIGLAIGMLGGGATGAAVGTLLQSESAVILSYIGGALLGAATGAVLGMRWISRSRDAI
jgi:hypothetical protein